MKDSQSLLESEKVPTPTTSMGGLGIGKNDAWSGDKLSKLLQESV